MVLHTSVRLGLREVDYCCSELCCMDCTILWILLDGKRMVGEGFCSKAQCMNLDPLTILADTASQDDGRTNRTKSSGCCGICLLLQTSQSDDDG